MKQLLDDPQAPARDLMERVLRNGEAIAPEYPLVFQEELPGRIIAVGDADEVRSACAILVRDFLVDGVRVRGGMIGSVATDPAWRDQGLATQVLIEAEAALQAEGCAFALLWAQDPDFYLKRGYGPIGTEEDFVISSELARVLPEPSGVRPMQAEDAAAIHRLYEQHSARLDRTPQETEALLACPGMVTLVREREGALVGYACLGRGHDLGDAIHEWGGETRDVLALVRAHLERRFPQEAGCLFLMAPTTESDVCYRLLTLGAEVQRGILGLAKILDPQATTALLDERLGALGTARLVEREGTHGFLVTGAKGEGLVDDDGALALLLGCSEVRPEVEKMLASFGLEDARLPLEPFVWGLDSI